MILNSKYTKISLLLILTTNLFSQSDSIKKQHLNIVLKNDSNTLFQNKKIITTDSATEPKLEIGAYVSSYYAYYTEDNITDFVKYPTMAARNNQFGLNTAMISFSYKSKKVRSTLALHYGDIAESTWPTKFNMIQEANAGVELIKNLWIDAGVFRSHIGLESTQPRENITSSMSLANVYEPYFFSGAKLTYLINKKLSIQLNAFNSFNSIVETNKNKLIGASIIYAPNKNLSICYNFITGDDTPDFSKTKYQRYYHNLYLTYQHKKFTLGAEGNYGLQDNTVMGEYIGFASMNSALLVLKHQTFSKIGIYGRGEWFSDEYEILSKGSNMGLFTYGFTGGIEYKPVKTVALSLEARNLTSDKPNILYNGYKTNQRLEGIFCLDVWF